MPLSCNSEPSCTHYLSGIPFRVSKLLAPVQVPEFVEDDPQVLLDMRKQQWSYSFEKEGETVSWKEKSSIDSGNSSISRCSSSFSGGSSITGKLGVLPAAGIYANDKAPVPLLNCTSVLLPSIVAVSAQAQVKAKTSPAVNIEEFEMLDSTPFHRLELKTLNEMDELRHVLTRNITVSLPLAGQMAAMKTLTSNYSKWKASPQEEGIYSCSDNKNNERHKLTMKEANRRKDDRFS